MIPETVILKGTVRTFEKGVQKTTKEHLNKLSRSIAEGYGASVEVLYNEGYPVMTNSTAETAAARNVAKSVSGQNVIPAEKIMGAEDFSFMLNSSKGAYILIGNGDSSGVHSPTYVFNDEVLPLGASFWAELVETRRCADN